MGRGADGGSRSAREESVGLEAEDSSKATCVCQRRMRARGDCLRTSLLCQPDAAVTFLLARLKKRHQFGEELYDC
jgi:hypothetical protein